MFQAFRVRKLTGKPAALTIADCESEARRIHLSECDYETVFSPFASESKSLRIHSDLLCRTWRIASLICFASMGVNLAAYEFGFIEPLSPLTITAPRSLLSSTSFKIVAIESGVRAQY